MEPIARGDRPGAAVGDGRSRPAAAPATCRDADLFGRFARAVARAIGRAVDRYLIWNEPNLPLWLQPQQGAGAVPGRTRRTARRSPRTVPRARPGRVPGIHGADPAAPRDRRRAGPARRRARLQRNAATAPADLPARARLRDERLRAVRTGRCRGFRPARSDGLRLPPARRAARAPDEPSPQPTTPRSPTCRALEALLDGSSASAACASADARARAPVGRCTSPSSATRPARPTPTTVSPRRARRAGCSSAAYRAWRDPRVRTLIQYEWRDEPLGATPARARPPPAGSRACATPTTARSPRSPRFQRPF